MTRQPIRITVLISLLLTYSACGNDEEKLNLPPDPGEAGKATLEGIDSDGDGVRDDLQRWILLNNKSKNDRTALINLAVTMQKNLVNASDQASTLANLKKWENAVDCVLALHEEDDDDMHAGQEMVQDLEAHVNNTPERMKAYAVWSTQLNGSVSIDANDSVEKLCGFKP